MTARKPGRIFWAWTFIVGIFSPGKGKRRISVRMQENWRELCTERVRNSELTKQIEFLRRELGHVEGENEMLRVQDDMNESVFRNPPAEENRPAGNKVESTMPLYAPGRPLANASTGNKQTSGNPPESS